MCNVVESSSGKTETVFIIDDDLGVRDGLCNFLNAQGLSATPFGSAEEFLVQWTTEHAGCLLLDFKLPGMNGVEFQKKLNKSGIQIPIVFMTGYADIPMVRTVMKSGAVDFLTKPLHHQPLMCAIAEALSLDRSRREQDLRLHSTRMRFQSLSKREIEVLERINAGLINKDIASELNLRLVTVKFHRQHVMEKMQANSLAELFRMCELLKLSIGHVDEKS